MYVQCTGLTVEVANTDAEGRFLLSDGLSWLAREKVPETSLLRHFMLKTEYLPSQARDKHRKSWRKDATFLQGVKWLVDAATLTGHAVGTGKAHAGATIFKKNGLSLVFLISLSRACLGRASFLIKQSQPKNAHSVSSGVISNDEELEKLAIKAGLASGDHVMPMIFAPEILCAEACPCFLFLMFSCVRSCPEPVLANPPFASPHKGNPKETHQKPA